MAMDEARVLSSLRKKRGAARSSVTRLSNRLKDLESDPEAAGASDRAKQLLLKLDDADSDFKTLHFQVLDVIDENDEEALQKEQDILDQHEDTVSALILRIQNIITHSPTAHAPTLPLESTTPDTQKVTARRLSRLELSLKDTEAGLDALSDDHSDSSLLEQYTEQLADHKRELSTIHEDLISLDLDNDHELVTKHVALEKLQFKCSHRVKKLSSKATAPVADGKGVRLPKLDVPTFDGDVLHWAQFWEQFKISIHDRSQLSDSEKLVYLQQAVKSGSAKAVIEGLSRTGENYKEAIDCLKSRFNRPRLLHRAHVRKIVEAPSLKDGSGKELRRLHDTVQQHLRALKAMGSEPDDHFVTSVIELKFDVDTMFEWQRHSQDKTEVPSYTEILEFLDLRAQASETSLSSSKKPPRKSDHPVTTFTANSHSSGNCILCNSERHPLYVCPKFKSMSHSDMMSTLRRNNLCINCLNGRHSARDCKSSHRCKRCQRPHHTILHIESHHSDATSTASSTSPQVSSNAAVKLQSSSLLMTCRVRVKARDGSFVEARALLDNASSASFVSERLAQLLQLPRSPQSVRVYGIAGSSPRTPIQSVASLRITPLYGSNMEMDLTAIVLPKVTCDLPVSPVSFDSSWSHVSDLTLADPAFGLPGRIDLLLGVDIFVSVLLHGRRTGPPGAPVAIETEFGWVLSGNTEPITEADQVNLYVMSFHSFTPSGDDILRKFWEIEEPPSSTPAVTLEEHTVLKHFNAHHCRTEDGTFVVPLPKTPHPLILGESRSQAVRRFLSLERSLNQKNKFQEFQKVMQEYLDLRHAELVPREDMHKSPSEVFYLPMHAVYKESSTTTKVRAVFDASAKTSTGVSLNDTLLVGPTVHPPLIDVLLKFRSHRIALTADISKMYRAIHLVKEDKDLHRFVWRSSPQDVIKDYRMTRVTFGVAASSFAANMAVKQNARDLACKYPLAAQTVESSFYVDDCLAGADNVQTAVILHKQLCDLFTRGGFLLRKWNSNNNQVLDYIPRELLESGNVHAISDVECTKTLGLEWNTVTDTFQLTVPEISGSPLTKRVLVSNIAKVFDVLGWFSPTIISMKILLQRVWESRLNWDEIVPTEIQSIWMQWRSELPLLYSKPISRYYFPIESQVKSVQLHGFSDASENAYSGVVYIRMIDSLDHIHVSLVMSKTRVSPIKRISIPRLELCGAQVLARLLTHVKEILQIPMSHVFAWTDSTIVLNWLSGSPRRFKTYVGNRVSSIVEQIPPDRWNHVIGVENPADCASRGILPSELLQHKLWWDGPPWLKMDIAYWPHQDISVETIEEEEREVCLMTSVQVHEPVIPLNRFSSFNRLQRVTAWIMRFINRCRRHYVNSPNLTIMELITAEKYWIRIIQEDHFSSDIALLKAKRSLGNNSSLLSLRPFLDSDGLLRVGGRESNSDLTYQRMHPLVIHGKHIITKLIIQLEHIRMLHAGLTLLCSTLSNRFHIFYMRKVTRSIVRKCVICRRHTCKPQNQLLGQLPLERVTPGSVFQRVGVDYAGPVKVKYGMVRKPTVVKAYICVFVSLSVKAVHLEAVTDLTSEAFIAALRRFIARRGYPTLIWSDNGTNFVGANREIKEFHEFLKQQQTNSTISEFCSISNIEWRFIPEHGPNFGGLWEAAVKSTKTHLKRIVGDVKLSFEELTTILTQIEACLNSRPLVYFNSPDDDGIEILTPGHFLIGQSMCSLPDPAFTYRSVSLLKRWDLCQNLTRHFWKRWSEEYLTSLNRYNHCCRKSRNLEIGDVVLLKEDGIVPTQWPLARITEVFPGKDGLVRVAMVRTTKGVYKRPVSKIALLLPSDSNL